jgi:hypothetical protein
MNGITVYIESVGLCGPGLENWHSAQIALRGEQIYKPDATVISSSNYLPTAERRRVGTVVKLALATATDALKDCAYSGSNLLSIFSSSGGDGDNCHMICEALASEDRAISPTRFTNSVHNAPSGYWGIALKAKPASTSLCAYDASFSAGLLEAATQSVTAKEPVLLIAYDTPYPEPLHSTRPILASFGVALLISHKQTNFTLASVQVGLGRGSSTSMVQSELEALRNGVPAARCLPLLEVLAKNQSDAELVLDLFENQQLLLHVKNPEAR